MSNPQDHTQQILLIRSFVARVRNELSWLPLSLHISNFILSEGQDSKVIQRKLRQLNHQKAKLPKLKVTKCYGHILCHPKAAESRAPKEKTIFSSTDTNSKTGKPDCGVHSVGLQARMATAIISTQFTSPHTEKRMDLERMEKYCLERATLFHHF